MKSTIIIFSVIVSIILSCTGIKKQESIIGLKFKNYKQIEHFSGYSKISDTSVFEGNVEPKNSILHLKNATNNLILFNAITYDKDEKRIFEILDTLIISKTSKQEFITIGYCEIGSKTDVNLIGVVNKTNNSIVEDIKRIWKVNTVTNKIERILDLKGVKCWNQEYKGE